MCLIQVLHGAMKFHEIFVKNELTSAELSESQCEGKVAEAAADSDER